MCLLCEQAKKATKYRELPNLNIGVEFEGFLLFEIDKSYFTNAKARGDLKDFRDIPRISEEVLKLGIIGWYEKYLKEPEKEKDEDKDKSDNS